jgi:hypothetical protein
MTEKQAYRAMFFYLDAYFERSPLAELGSVLGDLQLLKDGKPADPAVTQEWKQAVQKAMGNEAASHAAK